jgi:saccharopine dehydrogenase-like NADP-dependent oxidoreductase
MNIVILGGCGNIGSFVTRDLIKFTDAKTVIADCRKEAAENLAAEWRLARAKHIRGRDE